jgi:hypothetical protein
MKRFAVVALVLLGLAVPSFAGGPPVPEIDPAGVPAALTLLGGALLVIRGRRRR